MQIVEAWLIFGAHIHQDFLLDYPNFIEGVDYILSNMTALETQQLKDFLGTVLNSNVSESEMLDLWQKSGTEILVDKRQIHDFLEMIYQRIPTGK